MGHFRKRHSQENLHEHLTANLTWRPFDVRSHGAKSLVTNLYRSIRRHSAAGPVKTPKSAWVHLFARTHRPSTIRSILCSAGGSGTKQKNQLLLFRITAHAVNTRSVFSGPSELNGIVRWSGPGKLFTNTKDAVSFLSLVCKTICWEFRVPKMV